MTGTATSIPFVLRPLAGEFIAAAPYDQTIAAPLDVSFVADVSGNKRLRIEFGPGIVQPRAMFRGSLSGSGAQYALRLTLDVVVGARFGLGRIGLERIEYEIDAASAVAGGVAVPGQLEPGSPIAGAAHALTLGFVGRKPEDQAYYIHPAVALRVIAAASVDVEHFLYSLLEATSSGGAFLGLDDVLAVHAQAKDNDAELFVILGRVLDREYAHLESASLLTAFVRDKYHNALELAADERITQANLLALASNQVLFDDTVSNAAEHFRYWYVHDRQIRLAVFEASEYQLDIINMAAHPDNPDFEELWTKAAVQAQLFTTASYRAIFSPPFFHGRDIGERSPGMGRRKFRDDDTVYEAVPARDGLYWIAQRDDFSVHIGSGRLPADAGIKVGIGGVVGAIEDGTVLEGGFVSSFRQEEDRVGIPILGTLVRNNKKFLFWMCRPHATFGSASATYDDMMSLLTDLGVDDAVITDGSDSVGLILHEKGIIEKPSAAFKLPFIGEAIGLRRRQP